MKKWQTLGVVGCLTATLTTGGAASAANVALGGQFLSDGAWRIPGATGGEAFDGSYASGQTEAGWDAGNRLFGVRMPTLSAVDSFKLFITGGPGSRSRPNDVRMYYEGGSMDLTLPNNDATINLGSPIETSWLVFRELSLHANSGDANYFLNELEVYGTPTAPPAHYKSIITGISSYTGNIGVGSAAALADGKFDSQGALWAPAESGNNMSFTANLAPQGDRSITAIALTFDFTNETNANIIGHNLLREVQLQFNDPSNTIFVLDGLNPLAAGGALYDNAIPSFYSRINLPGVVYGATQVTVTLRRTDPEAVYGPGPSVPTLPIGDRTTWGTAQADNNRLGLIEFEVFIPEPSTALLLAAATLFGLRRRR